MKQQVLKGKIDITRPSRYDGKDVISITLKDDSSLVRFLEIELSPETMMMALTGLSGQEVEFKVRNLELVGKKRLYEPGTVDIPRSVIGNIYSKDEIRKYLVENCQREGWVLDPSIDTQSSVRHLDGAIRVNFAYRRYIDPEPS